MKIKHDDESKARRTNLEKRCEIRSQLCNKLEKNLPNHGNRKCKDPEMKKSMAHFQQQK